MKFKKRKKISKFFLKVTILLLLVITTFVNQATITYSAAEPASVGSGGDSKSVSALNALSNSFKSDGSFSNSENQKLGCAFVGADLMFCEITDSNIEQNPVIFYYLNMEATQKAWTANQEDPNKNKLAIIFTAIKGANINQWHEYQKESEDTTNNEAIIEKSYIETTAKPKNIDKISCVYNIKLEPTPYRFCEEPTEYKYLDNAAFDRVTTGKKNIIIYTEQTLIAGYLSDNTSTSEPIGNSTLLSFTNLGNADDHPGGAAKNQCNLMEYKETKPEGVCKDIGGGGGELGTLKDSNFGDFLIGYADSLKEIESLGDCGSGLIDKYLFCPVMSKMRGMIGVLVGGGENPDGSPKEGILTQLLELKPLQIRQDNSTEYTPIANMMISLQSLSYVFYVIIFILALILNVFGLETYNIKKILPRLVIATIATFASIYIMQFAIDITNVFGKTLPNKLYEIAATKNDSCFTQSSTTDTSTDESSTETENNNSSNTSTSLTSCLISSAGSKWDDDVNGIGGSLEAAGIGIASGAIILIAFLVFLIVLITLIMAIVALAVRQFILFVCILLAPIAFALSVLPNTQSLYKKWYSTLFNNLALFPIITGLITLSIIIQRLILES